MRILALTLSPGIGQVAPLPGAWSSECLVWVVLKTGFVLPIPDHNHWVPFDPIASGGMHYFAL